MKKPKYKEGQKIVAKVYGETWTGEIEQVDEHKGRIVYDLKDQDRYVTEDQIVRVVK